MPISLLELADFGIYENLQKEAPRLFQYHNQDIFTDTFKVATQFMVYPRGIEPLNPINLPCIMSSTKNKISVSPYSYFGAM